MSRYQHKGETVAEIPPDWAVRFDATTKYGITYNTDEATNDIETWSAQGNGYSELTVTSHSEDYPGVGTRPAYLYDADGFPHVRFYGPGNYMMRRVNIDTANPDIDAAFRLNQNATMFLVCQINDMTSASTASHYVMGDVPNEWKFGYIDQGPETTSFINPWDYQSTNDFEDRRVIAAWRLIHHGTDDNQAWGWIGKTQLYTGTGITDTNCAGHLIFGMGATQAGSSDEGYSDCNIYESIWYPRALTDAEVDDVIDYLSARWQTTNIDSAGDTISTSTARTWASPSPDKEGHALASYTPVNYRVEPLPNTDAPRNANNEVDSLFPSSLANLRCWFRSDHTGGMTFATGDAQSGGTVSSWTDLTGNVTVNTTASGDPAVDFHPSGAVKGGFPSIEGGTVASPKSLESTGPITFSGDTDQQRLYWSVGTFGDASKQTCWGTPHTNHIFCATNSVFSGDMVDKPVCSAVGSSTGWNVWGIADAGLPADDGRIHIMVWRLTDVGATGDVECWYSGLKLPDRNSTSAVGNPYVGIGALTSSNYDAHGAQMLEIGLAGQSTATPQTYSDADVENLIQYLCARYKVDYMPANTPITIGSWTRQTDAISETDCCLWYDPSTAGAERWPLHPNVAQYHTTPANFDMVTGAEGTAVGMSLVTGQLNHTAIAADETATSNQHMEMANAYVSTETTDFPADSDGMSAFQVWRLDSATTTSYGGQCGSAISYGRTDDVSSTDMLQHSSDKSVSHASRLDSWLILGASYAYDDDGTGSLGYPGSTDGTPAAYLYCNNDPMQSQDDAAATSFSVQNFVNWDSADGTCKVLEQVVFKHPLAIEEIAELKKYFQHKYSDKNWSYLPLAWWSDWRTATGTGTTAIYDGGKWGGGSWPYDIEVVSATGLGFPAGMTNVFQSNVDLTGGDLTVWEEWPQIAIGEALAFRIYMRHDMTNAGSDNIAAYNYMICPGGGSPLYAWQYRFGIRANDDIFDFGMDGYNDTIDMDELAVEYGSGTVFCIEWSFERVTTSTYRCRTKVTDPDDYETVYGTADTVTADFTDLEVAVSSSPAGKDVAPTRLLQLGWFGVGGGNWTNLTGSFYFGGVAVAITDPGEWIGAYPVTEENGAAPARRVIVVT